MTDILNTSTMWLNFAGVVFAAIYIFINVTTIYSDAAKRSASILTAIKTSITLSMVFAFLTCLLVKGEDVFVLLAKASHLYTVIANSWLVVLLLCGIGLLYNVISKKDYSVAAVSAIKVIFKVAVVAVIISIVLSWLLS